MPRIARNGTAIENANLWIENTITAQGAHDRSQDVIAAAYATLAQTFATLELAEQQRIANLLAMAQFKHVTPMRVIATDEVASAELRSQAWIALGLPVPEDTES